jgi:hypothetical protein
MNQQDERDYAEELANAELLRNPDPDPTGPHYDTTREPSAEYRRLRAAWAQAYRDNDADSHVEQTAWDALVDYVEAHDLNFTELDPRDSANIRDEVAQR